MLNTVLFVVCLPPLYFIYKGLCVLFRCLYYECVSLFLTHNQMGLFFDKRLSYCSRLGLVSLNKKDLQKKKKPTALLFSTKLLFFNLSNQVFPRNVVLWCEKQHKSYEHQNNLVRFFTLLHLLGEEAATSYLVCVLRGVNARDVLLTLNAYCTAYAHLFLFFLGKHKSSSLHFRTLVFVLVGFTFSNTKLSMYRISVRFVTFFLIFFSVFDKKLFNLNKKLTGLFTLLLNFMSKKILITKRLCFSVFRLKCFVSVFIFIKTFIKTQLLVFFNKTLLCVFLVEGFFFSMYKKLQKIFSNFTSSFITNDSSGNLTGVFFFAMGRASDNNCLALWVNNTYNRFLVFWFTPITKKTKQVLFFKNTLVYTALLSGILFAKKTLSNWVKVSWCKIKGLFCVGTQKKVWVSFFFLDDFIFTKKGVYSFMQKTKTQLTDYCFLLLRSVGFFFYFYSTWCLLVKKNPTSTAIVTRLSGLLLPIMVFFISSFILVLFDCIGLFGEIIAPILKLNTLFFSSILWLALLPIKLLYCLLLIVTVQTTFTFKVVFMCLVCFAQSTFLLYDQILLWFFYADCFAYKGVPLLLSKCQYNFLLFDYLLKLFPLMFFWSALVFGVFVFSLTSAYYFNTLMLPTIGSGFSQEKYKKTQQTHKSIKLFNTSSYNSSLCWLK